LVLTILGYKLFALKMLHFMEL